MTMNEEPLSEWWKTNTEPRPLSASDLRKALDKVAEREPEPPICGPFSPSLFERIRNGEIRCPACGSYVHAARGEKLSDERLRKTAARGKGK